MSQRYLPTPEQIQRECARIREGWSEVEFYSRAGLRVPSYLLDREQQARTGVLEWQPPRLVTNGTMIASDF